MIKIEGDNNNVLSVCLNDILDCIAEGQLYYWNILWITAVGNLKETTMLEYEERVNNSSSGIPITWNDLISLSLALDYAIELVIIGDKNQSKLFRYSEDFEMYSECEYVIELVDSSFWEIHTKNKLLYNIMANKFPIGTSLL